MVGRDAPAATFRVGDRVLVPWGSEDVEAEIVDVWGNPPEHVRVRIEFDDAEGPDLLLLNPRVVRPM